MMKNDPKTNPTPPGRKPNANWANKTILIADDARVNFLLFKALLGETKARLIWASNGKKAVEWCRVNPVDLVLMDFNMPEMNGFDAASLIKKIHKDLPVISQTNSETDSADFQDITSSCDDFIMKPVSKDLLISKLGKFLNT